MQKKRKISVFKLSIVVFVLVSIFAALIFGIYKLGDSVLGNSFVENKATSALDTNSDTKDVIENKKTELENPLLGRGQGEVGTVKTPEKVKSIYMSSYAVSSETFRKDLLKFIVEANLNSIVIDIKDNDGSIVWNEKERTSSSTLRNFIKDLHEKNIYVIGRIATFEDPKYAKENQSEAVKRPDGSLWKNRKGIHWVDAASSKMWDYVVSIAKTGVRDYGFDEINFDYVRYPTDGDMKSIHFKVSEDRFGKVVGTSSKKTFVKREVLKNFFNYLDTELRKKENIKISADVFGMTTVADGDFGIGQMITDALTHFDYVSPMVYPSHFYPGTLGHTKPDLYPYDVIYWSMGNALLRAVYGDKDLNLKYKVLTLNSSPDSLQSASSSSSQKTVTNSTSTITTLEKLEQDYEKSNFKAVNNIRTLEYLIKDLENKEASGEVSKFDRSRLRPWYQDFDLNKVDYGVKEVGDQVRAGNALGLTSFFLWDASNKYTRGIDYGALK